MRDFTDLFESFSGMKIGVIGDLMLDTYMWGHVERISPEAPVPVVTLHHKEYRIGGAGNVALNCRSLGADVAVLSVIGKDEDASMLNRLLKENQINTGYVVNSADRITTSKTRIISRNQQMIRIDSEITKDVTGADEKQLLDRLKQFIQKEKPAVLIFEDYNKGVLSEKIISESISQCIKAGIITAVDPKRKNFFSYKGVDIFKPNLKEVREGLNLLMDDFNKSNLQKIHNELKELIGHSISLITLSEKGVFYQRNKHAGLIPSHLRNIADVSGAGDTVIAVAAMVYAATNDVHLMAEMANIAGGLVCEEVGTVAINKEKFMNESSVLLA